MTLMRADAAAIARAASLMRAGGVVALPTETVYGLGADAGSAEGVAAIYRIKGRPAGHPLIVHVLDPGQAAYWAEFDAPARRLAEAFWPGPLTLILRRRAGAPAHACGAEATIGLRAPAHPVARALLAALAALGGHGIAAPSANRFGRVSPTRAQHVLDDLGDAVPLVLDGGDCVVGVESTIVDLSRGQPVLLRPGGVSAEAISQVLGEALHARDAHAPKASGTLAAHYAPRTPLELVDPATLPTRLAQLHALGQTVAVWSPLAPRDALRWVPQPTDPQACAQALYDTLRALDASGAARILVARPPVCATWDAVADRLARAAATFEVSAP
jgi:L-threonylcarbamoyladenylate synthase